MRSRRLWGVLGLVVVALAVGMLGSGSARSHGVRTLWMAGELGLDYEHLDYAPRSSETRTQEYLALNPNGRVPTIDDDGFVLSESMAINMYLAKKHGKLYPADPKNDALGPKPNTPPSPAASQ